MKQGIIWAARLVRGRGGFGSFDSLSEMPPSRFSDCDLMPLVPKHERQKAKSAGILAEAKADAERQPGANRPDCHKVCIARNKALKAAKLDLHNTEALLLAAKLSELLGDQETDPERKEMEYDIANQCLLLTPMSLGEAGKRNPLELIEIHLFSHDLGIKRGCVASAEASLWCAFFQVVEAIVERRGLKGANDNIYVEFRHAPENAVHKGRQETALSRLPEIRRLLEEIFALDKPFDPKEAIRSLPKNGKFGNQRNEEIRIRHSKAMHAIRLENRAYYPKLALRGVEEAAGRDPENQMLRALLGEISLFVNRLDKA